MERCGFYEDRTGRCLSQSEKPGVVEVILRNDDGGHEIVSICGVNGDQLRCLTRLTIGLNPQFIHHGDEFHKHFKKHKHH